MEDKCFLFFESIDISNVTLEQATDYEIKCLFRNLLGEVIARMKEKKEEHFTGKWKFEFDINQKGFRSNMYEVKVSSINKRYGK